MTSAPGYWFCKARMAIALLACVAGNTFAAEKGKPFDVTGERIDIQVPAGWKLAWMEGSPDGDYFQEFIPESENIDAWRKGYLSIKRIVYPSTTLIEEIKRANSRVADVALAAYLKTAATTCSGKNAKMLERANDFNGVHFAVEGGFCDQYGPAAPFGEGAIAFAEGQHFLFRIQYGWRPENERQAQSNLPWRESEGILKNYIEAIKASSLCGGAGQPVCKYQNTFAQSAPADSATDK